MAQVCCVLTGPPCPKQVKRQPISVADGLGIRERIVTRNLLSIICEVVKVLQNG